MRTRKSIHALEDFTPVDFQDVGRGGVRGRNHLKDNTTIGGFRDFSMDDFQNLHTEEGDGEDSLQTQQETLFDAKGNRLLHHDVRLRRIDVFGAFSGADFKNAKSQDDDGCEDRLHAPRE